MIRTNSALLGAGLCLAATAWSDNRTTAYTYTGDGRIQTIDGPRLDVADVTRFRYDTAGNLTTMTNALGQVIRYTDYDSAGRLLRMVDANGLATRFTYHPRGWLLTRSIGEDNDAATTHYDYDSAGNITRLTFPAGDYLDFTYDAAGRLTEIRDASGNRVRYTFDAAGNRTAEQVEDPMGVVTRMLSRMYDDLSRLRQQLAGAPGLIVDYAYDRNGNPTMTTDGLKRTRSSSYDALDRLISEVDPALGLTELAYDSRDNLVAVSDPRGNTTRYHYSAFDERTSRDSPDTGTTSYRYDAAGNLLSMSDARGVTVNYTHDVLNRLIHVSYPDPQFDVILTYDEGAHGIGRLTGMHDASGVTRYGYDRRGNRVSESWVSHTGIEAAIHYRYDANDRIVGMTYPSGREVSYHYDRNGDLVQIGTQFDGESSVLADQIEQLPFGPVSHWISGNGLRTLRQFDLDYQLVRLSVGDLIDRVYTRDAVGNIVSAVDGIDASQSQQLGYDLLDRLSHADGGYGTLSFDYDAVGNRLASSLDGITTELAYEPDSNRLANEAMSGTQYEHDPSGNRTVAVHPDGAGWHYHYGDDNRLRSVVRTYWKTFGKGKNQTTEMIDDEVASFGYNGNGERVQKRTKNGTVYFRYGRKGELLAEIGEAGNVLREYVYLDRQPLAIATYEAESAAPVEIVVDDGSAQVSMSGAWALMSDRKHKAYDADYRVAEDSDAARFRWTPQIGAGNYDVQAWWVADRTNASRAPFVISHRGQTDTLSVDQTKTGGQWVSLGTFDFDGSNDEYVEVSNVNGRTVADAVRLVGHELSSATLRSTGIQYLHADHLGTPQALTDESGHVLWRADYGPFGEATVSGDPDLQPLRFPGQYYDDETGLHYNYFRDYDPKTGRYIQSDPIGLIGGLNTYSYVEGNPFRYADPYGQFKWHGNWCGGNWTGGLEKPWDQLAPDEWRKVKGPIDPLDGCCVVHDKAYADCRNKYPCDQNARRECFKSADRQLYRCSRENPIGGGFDEWGLREWMRRSRPGPESNGTSCLNP